MASVAQIEANRSNAQKSTGPRTAEGKATASRNAVKHGLLAEQVVIHGEDPAEFDLYRQGMLEELAPEGAVETMLAERAVSLAWRLRRAERLQSAVFATVYRENANDVVLWPKHGLPIEPKPDEEAVILGQVVMTDFARAQVLDRLLVHERRIESSLYRTMAELRKEREARAAAEASPSQGHPAVDREVNKVNQVNTVLTPSSKGVLAVNREPAIPAELGSFGENASEEAASDGSDFPHQTSHIALEEKITPCGVTTNGEEPAAQAAAETLHASRSILRNEANPGGSIKFEVSSFKWEGAGLQRRL
ncbi:MAG: hypothetical protein ABFE01_29790 [Phycisphaerales bacterium]